MANKTMLRITLKSEQAIYNKKFDAPIVKKTEIRTK